MSPLRGGLEELEEDILAYKDIINYLINQFLTKLEELEEDILAYKDIINYLINQFLTKFLV